FRISKGVLNVNDQGVNDSFSPEEIRVPFRNVVYIGDSDTDVPCMKLVNSYGGHSIAVYNAETEDKSKVYKMMREGRIKYYTPADYSKDSKLDKLIKAIIDRTVANETLENIHVECKKENLNSDMQRSTEEKKKSDLIMALENSNSFASTHMVIKDLKNYGDWSAADKESLFKIAIKNSQVSCVLGDKDVKGFYKKLLKGEGNLSVNAKLVEQKLKN
ncbi:MAG: HAD family hydrolase, partial [Clostridia bacterium]|nr:HAD family hydrolase [Clostridia bacterium]